MKKTVLSLLVLSIAAVPARLFACDGTGHATGGALTYYILKKNNPARVSKIPATPTLHPWYNSKRHDKIPGLSPRQKEVSLFMLASAFLDDARRTHYDRPAWHYIDYPFAPPGQGGTPQQPPVPNAETRIDSLVHALKTAPEMQSSHQRLLVAPPGRKHTPAAACDRPLHQHIPAWRSRRQLFKSLITPFIFILHLILISIKSVTSVSIKTEWR